MELLNDVAPLTRSVDWNSQDVIFMPRAWRSLLSRGAWIEIYFLHFSAPTCMSLLSRGAWIEISSSSAVSFSALCRSSHEERGLKLRLHSNFVFYLPSLLSRGAWIEIKSVKYPIAINTVAPLTRSVDWNINQNNSRRSWHRRSSHEERGLKYRLNRQDKYTVTVAPLTRSVDWNKKSWRYAFSFWSRSSHEERGLKYELQVNPNPPDPSLLSRGAWIEIT